MDFPHELYDTSFKIPAVLTTAYVYKEKKIQFLVNYTLTEHINNIFKDKELDENTSVGFFDESSNHRPSKYYNLDVILSVGYRVNSKRGIAFKRWANKILKIERHVFNLKMKDRVIDNSSILKKIDLFLK